MKGGTKQNVEALAFSNSSAACNVFKMVSGKVNASRPTLGLPPKSAS